jgi:hypothetical protein
MLSRILLSRLSPYVDENLGTMGVDFDVTDQQLVRCSAFDIYCRKNGSTMGLYISYLQPSRRPIIQLVVKYRVTEKSHNPLLTRFLFG